MICGKTRIPEAHSQWYGWTVEKKNEQPAIRPADSHGLAWTLDADAEDLVTKHTSFDR